MMTLAEFEIFLRYAEIFVDKKVRDKAMGEMKDYLDRLEAANGGAKKLRRADEILKESEIVRQDYEAGVTDLALREESFAEKVEAFEAEVARKEEALRVADAEAKRAKASAEAERDKARKEVAATQDVRRTMEVVKEEFERKLEKLQAAASAVS